MIDATICLLPVFYLLIYFWWYNKQETVSHETELISYLTLTACKTYVGDKGLTFWNDSSLPVTETNCTRFTVCTRLIGLICRTSVQCLWSSHFRKEEPLLQQTSQ